MNVQINKLQLFYDLHPMLISHESTASMKAKILSEFFPTFIGEFQFHTVYYYNNAKIYSDSRVKFILTHGGELCLSMQFLLPKRYKFIEVCKIDIFEIILCN